MAFGLLKANLPWIAPTGAILIVGLGLVDRDTVLQNVSPRAVTSAVIADVPETISAPQAASNLAATVSAAQAETTPAPAPTSTAAQVVAMVEAATNTPVAQPEVTRDAPLSTALLTEPAAATETIAPAPMTPDEASAFFASAQENLVTASSCGDDLRALAANARIYFPSGGLAGEDAGLGQARLIGLVALDCPGFTIQVEGHSDPSGDPQINLRLSQQRAEAVIARLAASGIDTSKFIATGFGDQRPSNVRGTEDPAYYDRRVE